MNEVVADEHSNVVDGLINRVKIPLVLDIGAQISVVPKTLSNVASSHRSLFALREYRRVVIWLKLLTFSFV